MDNLQVEQDKQFNRVKRAVLKNVPNATGVSLGTTTYDLKEQEKFITTQIYAWNDNSDIVVSMSTKQTTTTKLVELINNGAMK